MKVIDNKYLQLSLVVILCLFVEYLCFGSILINPNAEVFAFGGDALFLYFNTTYHACYGSGMMLESMNYPFGESIFMTDAQGALGILLASLRSIGIDTCTYGIGIINGMILYLLPLCAIFVHLILRRFGVNTFLSIVVSVAIALMAPQTFRLGSHYGLSYPFYIPMCIYWVIRKYDLKHWEWKDLLFITTGLFFYLNNPYVGFAGLLFIPIITFFKIFRSKAFKVFYIQYFGITSSIILLGYGIIKFTDPFIHRIKEQKGFFYYNIDTTGLFNSPYGLSKKLLSNLFTFPAREIEQSINYGIIPLIVGILLPLYILYFVLRSKKMKRLLPSKSFGYILFGALILGIVACNGMLPIAIQDLIREYLRPLLLFKAPGRFIWLSYFVFAIWSVWWLSGLISDLGSKYLRIGLFSLIASLWMWDSASGLYKYSHGLSISGNMFLRTNNWKSYLKENNINPDDYQAILALPLMQGWSSKLVTPLDWRSQYQGSTMSIASGLPLVDGMLSRLSLDHGMNIVQLGSNPLIDKDLVNKMPDNRPILIMDMTKSDTLPDHQDYIVSRSTRLSTHKVFDLYKLELESLKTNPVRDSIILRFHSKNYLEPIHYNGFDDLADKRSYRYQRGSKKVETGPNQLLYSIKLNDLKDSSNVEVSFWTLFTTLHETTPKFFVKSIDTEGNVIQNVFIDSQHSSDVKNNWVKASTTLKASSSISEIKIYSSSLKDEIIDDFLIRYVDEDVVIDNPKADHFLWNNYIIER